MLWVDRHAQPRAWVSFLVTKPGAAFARVHEWAVLFSKDLLTQTCLSRHICVGRPAKKWHFAPPTWYPYRFQKFEPHVFLFQPCCLSGKFGREIASEQAPRTGPRVGTNLSTFLGHCVADFCAIFTFQYRIYPARIKTALLFWKLSSFGRHVEFSNSSSSSSFYS